MDGVLEALTQLLIPASVTGDKSEPTESHLPSGAQSEVVSEQPISDHTVPSVNDYELTEKSVQSQINNDFPGSQKTADDLSKDVVSAALHSAGSENPNSVDVNSASTVTAELPQPQSNVPSSSSDIISETSLMNSAAVTVNEDVDAGIMTEESLTHSLPPLSELPLTIPLCPPRYLKLSFHPNETPVSLHCHHFK